MDEQGAPGPEAGDEPALDDPLERDAQELRQMIDAGASTPEEIRALAERIRVHKALEESRWRSEVKPELLASKKWRYRRAAGESLDDLDQDREARRNLKVGATLLGAALLLVLLATQAGAAFVLVPLFGVLGYAWWQGRDPSARDPSVGDPGGPADPST